MSENRWIVVRNWPRFQHADALRGEGIPPWLRVYTKLLHNPDFERLTMPIRGLLLTIWLEFMATDGQLPVSSRSIGGQHRVRTRSLEALAEAGFITISASRPLATSKQHASPEKRREEEKTPYPLTGKTANPNGRPRQMRADEVPTMIDAVSACQHFIEGHAWDDSFDERAIIEEFGRIERGRRVTGTIGSRELAGLLEQWKATRQDRYGTPAELEA